MALHRDIFWIGRQWAVTGFGLQAIDQRLKGAFDIEAAQVWADDLAERMKAHAWLNAADFDKALAVARARIPEPQRRALPLVDSVLELIQPGASEPGKTTAEAAAPPVDSAPLSNEPPPGEALPSESLLGEPLLSEPVIEPLPTEPLPVESPDITMASEAVMLPALQASGQLARFLPQWRIRH